ncbi:MAG: prolyl oligopeptidase family serine peptidase [Actinobacteria bacterium]|nr:prolyl oligopeptidase family serine peptidase [Actinomycetota bacterium]
MRRAPVASPDIVHRSCIRRFGRFRGLGLVVAGAVALAACSGTESAGSPSTTAATTAVSTAVSTTAEVAATVADTAPASTAAAVATTEDADTAPPVDPTTAALVEARPVDVIVPDGLSDEPAPLVVVLHGYSGTADVQQQYFRFQDEAAARGAILAYPDGTTNQRDLQFWNATEACCNFFGADVDDVAYLSAVVDHVRSLHAVDPQRIYLAGHSNGGFMSYRVACERADLFAAVVSLAGATYVDPDDCAPSEPVSIAQVHGTLDEVIAYDGGDIIGNEYPSAAVTAATWAAYNGCDTAIEPGGEAIDLDQDLADAETTVARFGGCPTDGAVELWTIADGRHIPQLTDGFAAAVFDFFDAHPKG